MTRKPGDLPSHECCGVRARHLPVTGLYWCGYRHGDDTQVLLLWADCESPAFFFARVRRQPHAATVVIRYFRYGEIA